MSKKCAKCLKVLPASSFYRTKRSYMRSRCKICEKEDNPTQLRFYGISAEDWEELLDLQGRRCPICCRPEEEVSRWHTDHNHDCCSGRRSCGKCVRGILCAPCNTKLGWFERNRNRVEGYLSDEAA